MSWVVEQIPYVVCTFGGTKGMHFVAFVGCADEISHACCATIAFVYDLDQGIFLLNLSRFYHLTTS